MNYEQAMEMLQGFAIKPEEDWDKHCILVGDIAFRLANELKKYIDIDPEKVKVMGLVHDFGRSVTHDPYRHAYEGYKIMEKLNEHELARICACHSNGAFKPEEIDEYGLKPEDFYVHNIEEMLVFIGDSLENHGKIIRHEPRIRETIERYRFKNPEFIPVLKSKINEFKEFDNKIKEITGKTVYEILGI